ncbi:MAG: hypothetical protein ACRDI2_04180, partial [Chloroflexota bacterium]
MIMALLTSTLLGLGSGALPAAAAPADAADTTVYFPETGHYVSHALLSFYLANGQHHVFGYPITEPQGSAGAVVQWFQRARLEWRPGSGVQVGLLGQELARRYEVDTAQVPQPAGMPTWGAVIFAPPPDARTVALQRTGFDVLLGQGERWIEISLGQQR